MANLSIHIISPILRKVYVDDVFVANIKATHKRYPGWHPWKLIVNGGIVVETTYAGCLKKVKEMFLTPSRPSNTLQS